MKHIKEYEESEIKDLVIYLREVGQSDWTGYWRYFSDFDSVLLKPRS
jgi:hypothetical protein